MMFLLLRWDFPIVLWEIPHFVYDSTMMIIENFWSKKGEIIKIVKPWVRPPYYHCWYQILAKNLDLPVQRKTITAEMKKLKTDSTSEYAPWCLQQKWRRENTSYNLCTLTELVTMENWTWTFAQSIERYIRVEIVPIY